MICVSHEDGPAMIARTPLWFIGGSTFTLFHAYFKVLATLPEPKKFSNHDDSLTKPEMIPNELALQFFCPV